MSGPLILGTNSIKDTTYDVANSVRLDGSSAYMTRTMGTPTNTDKYTFSFWVKRSKLGVQQSIFRSTNGAASNDSHVTFQNDDTLRFEEYGGSSSIGKLQTNQVFRDTSAWYHIVLVYDSGNSTAGNRMRMYVNGTEVTSFGTDNNPSQNADSYFNKSGESLHFGRTDYSGGANYFSGYICEMVMCDGQALTPTDIGEFDEDSGIFKPIDVSGLTFGNNGFYLDFENSGSLGADVSGNGNNFTVSNLTSVDQSTDTCTNNFCTLNPLASGGNPTFSEGNLKLYRASGDGTSQKTTFSTIAASSGKWYAEVKIDSVGSNGLIIGFVNVDKSNLPNTSLGTGEDDFSAGIYSNGGPIFYSSGTTFATVGSYSADDILQLAMDIDNGYLYWGKNGTYLNSGDPTSGSSGTGGLALSNLTSGGTYTFAIAIRNNATIQMNYGSPPFSISSGNSDANGYGNFEYAVPSGYYSLCTKNLAEYG